MLDASLQPIGTVDMDLGILMLAVLEAMECAVTRYSWVQVKPIRLVLKSC
jgi:hypothetical protein